MIPLVLAIEREEDNWVKIRLSPPERNEDINLEGHTINRNDGALEIRKTINGKLYGYDISIPKGHEIDEGRTTSKIDIPESHVTNFDLCYVIGIDIQLFIDKERNFRYPMKKKKGRIIVTIYKRGRYTWREMY
ncbi:uncharacterized protein LOC111113242 isoform X2 [Crassostrea virginica]